MKVRAGCVYRYEPTMLDLIHVCAPWATPGMLVRVVNLPGAPKANTMGQCHIERADTGEFLGMVSTNSLVRKSPT